MHISPETYEFAGVLSRTLLFMANSSPPDADRAMALALAVVDVIPELHLDAMIAVIRTLADAKKGVAEDSHKLRH